MNVHECMYMNVYMVCICIYGVYMYMNVYMACACVYISLLEYDPYEY